MNHIHYMTSNDTVCWRPSLLGYDHIVVDYTKEGPTCSVCLALVDTHNRKSEREELTLALPSGRRGPSTKKDVNPGHGFLLGLGLATFFWVMFYVLHRWF